MSLTGDAVVYVVVLIAVLAVVALIIYGAAHVWKPPPDESQIRVTRAYKDALAEEPEAQRTV